MSQLLIETSNIVSELQEVTNQEISIFLTDTEPEQVEDEQDIAQYFGQSSEDAANRRYEYIRADLGTEINNGLLEVERDGNDVIIRIANQGSFTSGSAQLAGSFLSTLDRIGNALSNDDGAIRIEGHTDNVPIMFSDTFNSNWDLSAARSSSVASYLTTASGIDTTRVEVVG
ncbi:MAG: OmpA family protein, partial [Hyphomicrobiales bacterium]